MTIAIKRSMNNFFDEAGKIFIFLNEVLLLTLRGGFERQTFFEQLWKVTVQSLPMTMMAGFFDLVTTTAGAP